MTLDQDFDGFAAEYVLGTLDADERAQAEALMLVDQAFAVKVRQWERRLGELNVLVAPVEPPAPLWDKIRSAVEAAGPGEPIRLPELPQPEPVAAARSAEIIDLTQRLRRWRGLTVLTGALAACLVGIVVTREYGPDVLPPELRPKVQVVERIVEKEMPRPAQFVAVFQKDEQAPAFVLSVDVDKRTVTVRQVAAERLADKTYQVWMATQPGAAPHSLGLMDSGDFMRTTLPADDPAVINNATYGISLEPLGGSPTGAPTGPVIHARLVQVTEPQN